MNSPCGAPILWGISPDFSGLSPCYRWIAYVLLTRAPVAGKGIATSPLPLDLHVLGLSLAFILSQDQTLRCMISFYFFFTTCWLVTETFTRLVLLFLSIVISSRIACFSLSKTDCKSKGFILILQKKIPLFSITAPLSRKACAKVRTFTLTSKFFPAFFYIPTINISITACK